MKNPVINFQKWSNGVQGKAVTIKKKINVDEFFLKVVLGNIWLREDELIVSQVHLNNLIAPQND